MKTALVSVAELQPHLFDHDWCVFDCRHDLLDAGAGWRAYQEGHIPGALFAHIDEDLAGPKSGTNGRHPLPDRAALEQVFRDWGLENSTQIVAYDAAGGQFASRLWWLARWLGHQRVALLDGGWPAWLAATNWTSTEPAERPEGHFVAGASLERTLDASQIKARIGRADTLLVDARAPERYEGRVEPIDPVAGHIPGAVNRFWQDNLVDGNFKPVEQLRAEFERLLGGRPIAQLAVQCGSGVTACHHLVALEHAGLHGAALYPGSWSEWIADPTRPIATGSTP